MRASNDRVHRFYVPGGARFAGGCHVHLTRPAGPYDEGGTLAAPAIIRGVAIPAGSELFVDIDFDDIDVTLRQPHRVRGVALRAGDGLRFGNRIWIPMFLSGWLLPVLPLLLLYMFVRSRIDSRDIWVMRGGKYVFAIRPDGSTGPVVR